MSCIYCYTAQGEHTRFCPRCGAPLAGKDQPQQQRTVDALPTPHSQEYSLSQPSQPQFKLSSRPIPVPPQPVGDQTRQLILAQEQDLQVPSLPHSKVAIPAPEQKPLPKPSVFHVPQGYSKPRAIIPRYRVISGLLSLILVTLFICTGVAYYSGQGHNLLGFLKPANTSNAAQPKQNTFDQVETGPAYAIIPTVLISTDGAQKPARFSVNHPLKLIYHIDQPQTTGNVKTIWYKDDNYYKTMMSPEIAAKSSADGTMSMTYDGQCQGKVDIFWNDQLAQSLTFLVYS